MSEEGQRVEASLDRIRKFSKVVGAILRVSFVLVLLYWLAFTALSIVSMTFSVDFGIETTESIYVLLVLLGIGFIMAILLKIGSDVFKDVALGESPFTLVQARRFKAVSLIVLVYVLLEAPLSPGCMALLQMSGIDVGYVFVDYASSPSISINIGALLVAAVFFSLSLVFEYGLLLQELSDETL